MEKDIRCGEGDCKDPYSYTGFLIWVMGNILSQSIEGAAANKDNLPFNHFMVLASLFWLSCSEKKVNQRRLATYMHMREITVSTIMKKLEKKGYVSVDVDEDDKRSKLLSVTEYGTTTFMGMIEDVVRRERRIDSPGLQKKLASLLKSVSNR